MTEEGYLRVPALVARPGVLTYRTAQGMIRELVPPSTLQDAGFLESLMGKPVVNEHPPDPLNPDNVADYRVGTVLSVEYVDGKGVIALLQIENREAIDAIRAGKVEVSPAYQTEADAVSGVDPVYGPHDAVQRRRYAGNHIALTDRARGGSDVRLLLRNDSAGIEINGEVEIEPAQPPIVEPPLKLSPAMTALLAVCGLDPALYTDDATAAAAVLPKVQQMQSAIEGQEAAVVTLDAVPEAVATVAEMGPMADAPGMKMDSKRVDARRINAAKTHAALTKFHNEASRIDAAEKALGIEGGPALGLAARTKAIVLKLDPDFPTDETHAVYSAEFRAHSRQGFRADSAVEPSVGALLADPENRNNGGGRRQDSATPELTLSAVSRKAHERASTPTIATI